MLEGFQKANTALMNYLNGQGSKTSPNSDVGVVSILLPADQYEACKHEEVASCGPGYENGEVVEACSKCHAGRYRNTLTGEVAEWGSVGSWSPNWPRDRKDY